MYINYFNTDLDMSETLFLPAIINMMLRCNRSLCYTNSDFI